jgi:hypothetical protein
MLGDCTNVDTPVSSMLCTLSAVNFTRFKCTLKIVAELNYLCFIESGDPEQTCISGFRSVRFLCLFIKPCNQSIPAILLSNQLLGNLHSSLLP